MKGAEMEKQKGQKGQIRVTVQEADRLHAITKLAEAMVYLAKALNATPQVTVEGCYIQGSDTGISIDTQPGIWETMIEKLDNEGD